MSITAAEQESNLGKYLLAVTQDTYITQNGKTAAKLVSSYQNKMNLKSQAYQDLFPEEYKPHKEAHTVSWAITGAFPSGKIVFSVKKNWLESLDLCLPGEAGTVVAQEQLFVIPHIVANSA